MRNLAWWLYKKRMLKLVPATVIVTVSSSSDEKKSHAHIHGHHKTRTVANDVTNRSYPVTSQSVAALTYLEFLDLFPGLEALEAGLDLCRRRRHLGIVQVDVDLLIGLGFRRRHLRRLTRR